MGLKIYVGCLPGDASEHKVQKVFSQYGQITEVTLVTKKSNKCVGSGYVTCANQQTRDKILSTDVYYESRKLETSIYLDKSELQSLHEDINLRKLLVKNIPADLTNEELFDKFSIFGEVINAFISTDQKAENNVPSNSNYGIVIFTDRLSAYKALNGKFLLKGLPLIIRLHRFKNVGEAVYTVRGKDIKAKDLLDVQIGYKPKDDIRDLMPPSYQNEVFRFLNQEHKYFELMRQDRKKLKKDCKRNKDDELRDKLIEMEKAEKGQENTAGGVVSGGGLPYQKTNTVFSSIDGGFRGGIRGKNVPGMGRGGAGSGQKINQVDTAVSSRAGHRVQDTVTRPNYKPKQVPQHNLVDKKYQYQNGVLNLEAFPGLNNGSNNQYQNIGMSNSPANKFDKNQSAPQPSKWEDFDPMNIQPPKLKVPTNIDKKKQNLNYQAEKKEHNQTKTFPGITVSSPEKPKLQLPNTAQQVMVFNNPEFAEDNDNITTSSMQDDDIYEWSRASMTPSNKMSGAPLGFNA